MSPPFPKVAEYGNLGLRDATPLGLAGSPRCRITTLSDHHAAGSARRRITYLSECRDVDLY